MSNIELKGELLTACRAYVDRRIGNARNVIEAARKASSEDTKSSAGDKFETSREMMAQEQNKAGQQFKEAVEMKEVLDDVRIAGTHVEAHLGSYVRTDKGNFFLSIAAGKLSVNGEVCFAISLLSPVGQKIIGLKAGDQYEINGNKFKLKEVM